MEKKSPASSLLFLFVCYKFLLPDFGNTDFVIEFQRAIKKGPLYSMCFFSFLLWLLEIVYLRLFGFGVASLEENENLLLIFLLIPRRKEYLILFSWSGTIAAIPTLSSQWSNYAPFFTRLKISIQNLKKLMLTI